jgi:hypothetical protein
MPQKQPKHEKILAQGHGCHCQSLNFHPRCQYSSPYPLFLHGNKCTSIKLEFVILMMSRRMNEWMNELRSPIFIPHVIFSVSVVFSFRVAALTFFCDQILWWVLEPQGTQQRLETRWETNNKSWVHVIWSKEVGQRQLLYLVLSWSWELDCLNIPWRIFH